MLSLQGISRVAIWRKQGEAKRNMVRCVRRRSEWRDFCIGTVIRSGRLDGCLIVELNDSTCIYPSFENQNRLYVMTYLSYLILRRMNILEQLSYCDDSNDDCDSMVEVTVADGTHNLTQKAVLRMFRDHPNMLDSSVVIGVFAALIFLYIVAEGFSILTVSGVFVTKSGEKAQKKRQEVGQEVVVCIDNRNCRGIIHAQNENDTWHVIFSNLDVDELEARIGASNSVKDLVDLSKQITNVTSSEIEACDADVASLKNLLHTSLQSRDVAAEHVQSISSLGMYEKMQMEFPALFKVFNKILKLYKTYRLPYDWNENAQQTKFDVPSILVCAPQVPFAANICPGRGNFNATSECCERDSDVVVSVSVRGASIRNGA